MERLKKKARQLDHILRIRKNQLRSLQQQLSHFLWRRYEWEEALRKNQDAYLSTLNIINATRNDPFRQGFDVYEGDLQKSKADWLLCLNHVKALDRDIDHVSAKVNEALLKVKLMEKQVVKNTMMIKDEMNKKQQMAIDEVIQSKYRK